MEGCDCPSCRLAREPKARPPTQQAAPRGRIQEYEFPPSPMPMDEDSYAMENDPYGMEDGPYGQRLVDSRQIPKEWAKEPRQKQEKEPRQKQEKELPTVPTVPNISPDDIVIAVMGVTGAGKTTFIQKLTSEALEIGGSLESCTQDVAAHLCKLPGYSKKIWLLDTPGFDDTYKTDAQILADVAVYLSDLYSNQILLTGIIYLHRIQDPRTGQAAMRNIRTFKKLCGEDGLSRTVLVTTFWRYVTPEEGRRREEELLSRGTLWKFITDRGGKAFQYRETEDSAKQVIDYILESKSGKAALTIQVDLVDRGKKLGETEAGEEVKVQMAQLQQSYEKEIERLKTELEEVIRQKEEDVNEMREMLEAETMNLKMRVEQIEQGGKVFELSDDGLRKRMKVAWRVFRQKI